VFVLGFGGEGEMKAGDLLDVLFLSNPFHRGMVEKLILIGTGICGRVFSWTEFSIFPLSNILGVILILLGYAFHRRTEKGHNQAHEESRDIDKIVTTGVYSKIRHPLYLSLVVMNLGIALAFGVMITFAVALLTIIHWVLASWREEKTLLRSFPNDYPQYMQDARWRMIPGIF
jgi:protein-S-isoprenylcysteine O-methyltransferase Ste14